MAVVELARELNALLSELHEWREVGAALAKLEPGYPGLAEALKAARAEVRNEAVTPVEPPKKQRKRR